MALLVIDASATVEYLRWTPVGERVGDRISNEDDSLAVPHSCGVEVAHALRGLVLGKKMDVRHARSALLALPLLDATRHPVEPHLPRIWELRDNLTSYDAAYVALAEVLEAPFVTIDAKFDTPAVTRLIDVEVIA